MNQQKRSFMNATGVIEYNMTNNYMFRYILQKNQKGLKGLICALLHLKPEEIRSITIKNPINLSGDVSGKEFVLAINVMLNDDRLINLATMRSKLLKLSRCSPNLHASMRFFSLLAQDITGNGRGQSLSDRLLGFSFQSRNMGGTKNVDERQ